MACELVRDHKILKTWVWFSRILVTRCQIGCLGELSVHNSTDNLRKIRSYTHTWQNCSVSSLSRQWPLTWLSGIFVLCKSILPLFAAKLFRAAFNFRHFERNCQYFQQNSHHRIISQKNYTETKVSRPELKYQFVILKYINSFFLLSLCWKLNYKSS